MYCKGHRKGWEEAWLEVPGAKVAGLYASGLNLTHQIF